MNDFGANIPYEVVCRATKDSVVSIGEAKTRRGAAGLPAQGQFPVALFGSLLVLPHFWLRASEPLCTKNG